MPAPVKTPAEYRKWSSKTLQKVPVLRDYLAEKGYADSGITMNYVTDEDGTVEYTVTIHHRKIDKLDEEEKIHLAEECKGLEAWVDPYIFSIVFL